MCVCLSRYDPKTKKSEVLLDNLVFANGITLSPREDFLLVNEIGKMRILKVSLRFFFRHSIF